MSVFRTISLLCLAGVGCGGDDPGSVDAVDDTGTPMTTMEDELGPGAFEPAFETSPDFFTLMAAPVDGASPHGTVQIWYSSNARDLIEGGSPFTAPVGTVSIKTQDNGAQAIVVMVKEAPGFDPDNGDWSYEQREADGTLTNEGALAGCIACHAGFPDTDYLGGTDLR